VNRLWISAGLISLVTAAARSVAGHTGPLLDARMSDMAADSVGFFHAAWYVISALCILTAVVFVYIGVRPETRSSRELAALLSALFLISAVVVAVVNAFLGWSPATSVPVLLLSLIGAVGSAGVVSATSRSVEP
jgi:hypothetical protein